MKRVAAKGFALPEKTDAWTPIAVEPETKQNPTFFAVESVGKLKADADMQRLGAELKVVSAQLEEEYPRLEDGCELVPTKLTDAK